MPSVGSKKIPIEGDGIESDDHLGHSMDFTRHARHVSLPQVGVEGVAKLAAASVACIGAGGLGSPALLYLAAAGIGRLTIIDDDIVELSNLQRQVIHSTADIGMAKTESAKNRIAALDPNVEVVIHQQRLNADNCDELLAGHDVILDGSDNIPTRYVLDDACRRLGIPWVHASIFRFEGHISLFNHHGGPGYRDLFPEAPPPGVIPSCAEAGVLGVLPGVVGSLQANEAIKVILGIGKTLSGRLLIYDSLTMEFRELSYSSTADLPRHVEEPAGSVEKLVIQSIDVASALTKMEGGWNPFILDVRSESEFATSRIDGVDLRITHDEVLSAVEKIPADSDVLVHCAAGVRSQMAIMLLMKAGRDGSLLYNLDGGMNAWQRLVPAKTIRG
jgi:adenylyltransferase/sulfurtransferase